MSINDLLNYKFNVPALLFGLSFFLAFIGIIIIKNPSEKAPKFAGIVLTICGGLSFVMLLALFLVY